MTARRLFPTDQTTIGIDDSDDNAASVISDPTDDHGLEKWMPFLKIVNSQCSGIVIKLPRWGV